MMTEKNPYHIKTLDFQGFYMNSIYFPRRMNIPETSARQSKIKPSDGTGISIKPEAPETINQIPNNRNPKFFVIFIVSSFCLYNASSLNNLN